MARSERDVRLGIRDESGQFPARGREEPGYSQPDAVDPSGYALADPSEPGWTEQHAIRVGAARRGLIADRRSEPSDSAVYRDVYGEGTP